MFVHHGKRTQEHNLLLAVDAANSPTLGPPLLRRRWCTQTGAATAARLQNRLGCRVNPAAAARRTSGSRAPNKKLGARTRLAGAALRCERASRWRRSTTPAAACSRSSRRPQRTSPAVRRRAPPRRSSRRRSSSPRRSSTGAEPSAGPSLRIRSCSVCCSVFLGSSHLLLRLPPTCTPFSADLCCSCSVFRWRIFPSCSVCLVFSDAPPLRAGTRRRMRSCTARSSPATTWSPTPSRRRPTSAPSPRRCATAAACTSGSCTAC